MDKEKRKLISLQAKEKRDKNHNKNLHGELPGVQGHSGFYKGVFRLRGQVPYPVTRIEFYRR